MSDRELNNLLAHLDDQSELADDIDESVLDFETAYNGDEEGTNGE